MGNSPANFVDPNGLFAHGSIIDCITDPLDCLDEPFSCLLNPVDCTIDAFVGSALDKALVGRLAPWQRG